MMQSEDDLVLIDEQIEDGLEASGEDIAQYFSFDHLPVHLQEVSRRFADLAVFVLTLPRKPERTVALRKLLEGKDAAVRTMVTRSVRKRKTATP